ncbi:MAG: hypothetical protein AB1696_23550 [Planctomycetota bacterium]
MDMTIYCGKCGKKIIVDAKKAGQKIVCVRCQTKLPLPSQPTDEPQIRLYCIGCGHRVRAEVDQAGGEMRCPKCEHLIPLPDLDDAPIGPAKEDRRPRKEKAEEEKEAEEKEEQEDRTSKKRPKKKRREPQTVDYKISKEMRRTIDRIEREKTERDDDEEEEEEEERKPPRKRRRDEDADDFEEVVPIAEGSSPLKVFLVVFVVSLFIAIAVGVVYYLATQMRQNTEQAPSQSKPAPTRSAD